jgi:4-amino-4-deoxy-L-arabinose transferase-like glycosyltransferase
MRLFRRIRELCASGESTAVRAAGWGFLVRVGAILLLRTYRIHTAQDNFAFGYETGRIARALALGQGFSNPFHGITGPTAWEAPVYPYLVGGIFKVAGIYTQLSAFLVLTVNSLFSALTAIPVYWIARRLFGPRVAGWAAWIWALFPYSMYWATRWVWETSVSTFLMATAFWLALELADAQQDRSWRLWLWLAFLSAIIALTNPSCMTFLPCAWGWACFRIRRQRRPWLLRATVSVCVFLAVITPWEVRNYQVFHEVIPIRSNAGAELRLGNGPEAVGVWMIQLHPTQDALELQKYRQLGELAYVHMRGREAIDFMRRHVGLTAWMWLKKAAYFWAGVPADSPAPMLSYLKRALFLASSVLAWWGLALVIARRKHGAFLCSALLLVYPATYYIVFPHGRYRHPIEPIMMILIVYLISEMRVQKGNQDA